MRRKVDSGSERKPVAAARRSRSQTATETLKLRCRRGRGRKSERRACGRGPARVTPTELENVQASVERLTGIETLSKGGGAGKPFQVAREMAARAMHSEGLAALTYVGDQVLPAQIDALVLRGRLEDLAPIDERARFAKDPRMLDGPSSDHDPGAARLADRANGVIRGSDVTVH